MSSKSQTATEYLVITAVVIVIALIVVSALGGIPGLGGGMSESTARAKLSSLNVGISNYMISQAKGTFQIVNNLPNSVRIESIYVDGKKCWIIGSNLNPSLNIVLKMGEKKKIYCGSIKANPKEKFEYEFNITYTDLHTNSEYTLKDLKLVGTSSSFECPKGFIAVPGGFILADGTTVDDFCVMKYEAKEDSSGNCVNGNSANCPVSLPSGTPWVNINYTDSLLECQSLGKNYDLISDRQWMVLAENILNTPINDLVSETEGPQLGRGHSDNSPSNSIVAGTDSGTTNCVLFKSLNDSENSNCNLRTEGYTNTGNSFSQTYGSGREQIRTHVLSNGEVIWDLSANVYSWVKNGPVDTGDENEEYSLALDGFYPGLNLNDFSTYNVLWMKPSQIKDSSYGFGSVYVAGNGNSYGYIRRGGAWTLTVYAGIFTLDVWDFNTSEEIYYGFRCVYSP